MSVVACGLFGYTISAVSSIFGEVNKRTEELNSTLFNINRYMSNSNVSLSTQNAIRRYINFYYKEKFDITQSIDGYDCISKQLKDNIKEEINFKILE